MLSLVVDALADLSKLLDRSLDGVAELAVLVPRRQLSHPTRLPAWSVGTLLRHVIEVNWTFAALAEGAVLDDGEEVVDDHVLGVDHTAAFEASHRAAVDGWRHPDALSRHYRFSGTTLIGEQALLVHTGEVAVHGWDLAQATGAEYTIDADVADVLFTGLKGTVGPERRGRGCAYGTEVAVPDQAPTSAHLLGYLGRRP
jgi:uncharacterized protein (TIGR03086 family)